MPSTRPAPGRHGTRIAAALLLAALVGAAAATAYAWAQRREYARLDDAAAHQLDLYAAVLEVELGREADLPGMIDADVEIDELLSAAREPALRASVNRRLTRFAAHAGVIWAGVVDARGVVVASSDWFRGDTRLSQVAANEPCIAEALGGQPAQRFAPDAATGAPQVCFARPMLRDGTAAGAVAVRVSLEPIETSWADAAFRNESERPLVVDAQGTVIMSSVPAWKQRSLAALTEPVRTLEEGVQLVRVRGAAGTEPRTQVLQERALPRFDWRLMIMSSDQEVHRAARSAAWTAGTVTALLAPLVVLLLQRRRVVAQKLAARAELERARDELEVKVRQRTAELEASNRELRHEVQEREHAEQVLRRAQEDLVQAGKLALLGQLSAGISHELGQPLTALRALAQNGRLLIERGQPAAAAENFEAVLDLAERMGRITAQLKSFARKAPLEARSLRLLDAIGHVRQLLAARLQAEAVELQVICAPALEVRCDGHRLEQVLLNLVSNAVDAMRGAAERRLRIEAEAAGERVLVRVRDSGPGVPPGLDERLFEPFFTTKPPGEGLGLGLVISSQIVREFGGTLRLVPAPAGAVFEFDLAKGQPCSTDSASP